MSRFSVVAVSAIFLTVVLWSRPDTAVALKLTDGAAVWTAGTGMVVRFTPGTAMVAGDKVVLTFPREATVSSGFLFYSAGNEPVKVDAQAAPTFVRNATDNSVTVTLAGAATAGTELAVRLDTRVITGYNTAAYAQQSIAVNTLRAAGTPLDYGVALLTNANATDVTATVPLFLTMAVDDVTMDLGTLSTASVAEGVQHYTVTSNNRTGVAMTLSSDGGLKSAAGDVIDAVTDGAVTAGSREYGISTTATAPLVVVPAFATGDRALPTVKTTIAASAAPLSASALNVTYHAGIDGTTPAGVYSQVVTMTVATNA